MYQALIFDLDGTLLNTLPDIQESLNEVLTQEGLPTHGENDIRFFVGNGLEQLVVRALPAGLRRPPHVKAVLQKFIALYKTRQCSKTRPYNGIQELLAQLRSEKFPLAVLSNKDHVNTLEVVEYFFPGIFQIILGFRDNVPPKPHPAGALEIAEKFKLPPKKILYVGDSNVDMETAQAAQMDAVGVTWGFRPQEELSRAGASYLAKNPSEIITYLNSEQ